MHYGSLLKVILIKQNVINVLGRGNFYDFYVFPRYIEGLSTARWGASRTLPSRIRTHPEGLCYTFLLCGQLCEMSLGGSQHGSAHPLLIHLVMLLLETAVLSLGSCLEDAQVHALRIHGMVKLGLGIDDGDR